MIELLEKKDCCGCNACVQRCPKQCIAMQEDEEGFIYPKTDASLCIDCGLCEKICPVIHQGEPRKPLNIYAAINPNEEIRMKSSSGGVFTILAEQTIKKGGVVFGVRFNENWEVVHDYTETKEGLGAFRGSKYVQSEIKDNFKKAEVFLKEDRFVLFSGTPCQIAGLKLFLRKEYKKLLTVDFICHGVPSPGVWKQYLKEEIARQCAAGKNSVLTHPVNTKEVRVTDIQFRNKAIGWKKYSFVLTLSVPDGTETNTVLFSEPLNKNLFMRGFLADLYLRPSCYDCPSKCFKSGSNITIGDFWGIENVLPEIDDDRGVSLVMLNTRNIINEDCIYNKIKVNYKSALACNSAIENSAKKTRRRKLFRAHTYQIELLDYIDFITKQTINQRFKQCVYFMIVRTGLKNIIKKVLRK